MKLSIAMQAVPLHASSSHKTFSGDMLYINAICLLDLLWFEIIGIWYAVGMLREAALVAGGKVET